MKAKHPGCGFLMGSFHISQNNNCENFDDANFTRNPWSNSSTIQNTLNKFIVFNFLLHTISTRLMTAIWYQTITKVETKRTRERKSLEYRAISLQKSKLQNNTYRPTNSIIKSRLTKNISSNKDQENTTSILGIDVRLTQMRQKREESSPRSGWKGGREDLTILEGKHLREPHGVSARRALSWARVPVARVRVFDEKTWESRSDSGRATRDARRGKYSFPCPWVAWQAGPNRWVNLGSQCSPSSDGQENPDDIHQLVSRILRKGRQKGRHNHQLIALSWFLLNGSLSLLTWWGTRLTQIETSIKTH